VDCPADGTAAVDVVVASIILVVGYTTINGMLLLHCLTGTSTSSTNVEVELEL